MPDRIFSGKLTHGSRALLFALATCLSLQVVPAQSCPSCDSACLNGTAQWCGSTCLNCVACGAVYKAVCQGGTVNCVESPIVIDILGQGFHLTSVANGVKFTFKPGEPPRQTSWTAPGYSNGWLALDRNGNGVIDDATELFGDLTPQTRK